jgi:hypothetical protein
MQEKLTPELKAEAKKTLEMLRFLIMAQRRFKVLGKEHQVERIGVLLKTFPDDLIESISNGMVGCGVSLTAASLMKVNEILVNFEIELEKLREQE